MPHLPIHRSSQLTDFGVYLKTIISKTSVSSDRYAFSHTDDYYFFGFMMLTIFLQTSLLLTRYW